MTIFNFILLIVVSFCGTTQARTCNVGVNGCSWTCTKNSTAEVTCFAIPAEPKCCKIGSSETLCGTTCTCSETCKVGCDGCSWDCRRTVPPGQATCLAILTKPEHCTVGSSQSLCGTTCTCNKCY